MEAQTIVETNKNKKEPLKKSIILKKIDQDTSKLLNQLKDRANKKEFGRKVKDSEIISLALKQITPDHIKLLQEDTFSQKDRLAIAHEDYQKENGKLSQDQFIGKLLRGEISLKKRT
jgi:hypothetical protein